MGKQFVVVVKDASAAEKNAITEFFASTVWKYWHWHPDVWLINDAPDTFTAKSMHDLLSTISADVAQTVMFVFDMDPVAARSYWGLGPKDSWTWMQTYWGHPK